MHRIKEFKKGDTVVRIVNSKLHLIHIEQKNPCGLIFVWCDEKKPLRYGTYAFSCSQSVFDESMNGIGTWIDSYGDLRYEYTGDDYEID